MFSKDDYDRRFKMKQKTLPWSEGTTDKKGQDFDAKWDFIAENWVDVMTATGEASSLRKDQIERIYERIYDDRTMIMLRTKSGDVIETDFINLVYAKQMCI